MANLTEWFLWFHCNHHATWERYDSPCYLSHEKVEIQWRPDGPCTLYKNGGLIGRYAILCRWKSCADCALPSTDAILKEIRDGSGLAISP